MNTPPPRWATIIWLLLIALSLKSNLGVVTRYGKGASGKSRISQDLIRNQRGYHNSEINIYKFATNKEKLTMKSDNNRFKLSMNDVSSTKYIPRIIIAGAPASGKGTQCESIKNKFGVIHLSTGDMLRASVQANTPLGIKAKEYMDSGKLVPDDLIIDLVCDRLNEKDCRTKGWLLDGFPRTKSQAEALAKKGISPDCFILLDVPEEILVERVTGRRTDPVTGKIYHLTYNPPENSDIANRLIQRKDDNEVTIKTRYQEFTKNIDAVKSFYPDKLFRINGAKSQKYVTNAIMKILRNKSSRNEISNVLTSPRNMTLGGMLILILIDKIAKIMFNKFKCSFPSSLAAMVAIFVSLSVSDSFASNITRNIAWYLSDAVAFVKLWLPLFFVPPLVLLPLKIHLLEGKFFSLFGVTILGFLTSLSSSGLIAQELAKFFPVKSNNSLVQAPATSRELPKLPPVCIPLTFATIGLAFAKFGPQSIQKFNTYFFGVSATVSAYVLGTLVPTGLKKIIHPVVTSGIVTVLLLNILGIVTGNTSSMMLTSYYGTGKGSGDLISSLLGPAIVSFGLQLFQYRSMLLSNKTRILLSTGTSAFIGLFSTAFMARLFNLLPPKVALATLTRCITSPLALAGASILGADQSLAVLLVVITGMLGASFGETILTKLGVKEDIAVGLSIGSSAHGLGTAALTKSATKFSSAVVSMSLTGLWTVALLSVEPLQKLLLKIVIK